MGLRENALLDQVAKIDAGPAGQPLKLLDVGDMAATVGHVQMPALVRRRGLAGYSARAIGHSIGTAAARLQCPPAAVTERPGVSLQRWRRLRRAGPAGAGACAAVRAAASHQQLRRLSLGFARHRCAAAVFTRASHAFAGGLASYPLIGTLAATAITQLGHP